MTTTSKELREAGSSTSRENSRFAYSNSERETFAQGSRKAKNDRTWRRQPRWVHAGSSACETRGKMFAEQFRPDTRSNVELTLLISHGMIRAFKARQGRESMDRLESDGLIFNFEVRLGRIDGELDQPREYFCTFGSMNTLHT